MRKIGNDLVAIKSETLPLSDNTIFIKETINKSSSN